jgi:hypothetical protein
MGLGKSVLMDELRESKQLGAEITYCKERKSYYDKQEFIFSIGKLDSKKQYEFRGGKNSFEVFL